MASFLDAIRMNSIYPSDTLGPPNPGLAPPDFSMGAFNPMDAYKQIYPYLQAKHVQDRNEMQSDLAQTRQNRLYDIGTQMRLSGAQPNQPDVQQPNVKLAAPPPISDYQKGELAAKQAALQEKTGVDSSKMGNAQTDEGIKQQRANVYEYKAKNPDHKIITPGDGHVYAINPKDGSKIDLGIDTLSNEDKLQIQGQQKIEQIDETGNQSRITEGVKNKDVLGQIGARVKGTEDINTKKGQIVKPDTSNQLKQREINNARELTNTRPDLAKAITFDDKGNFTVNTDGLDADSIHEINRAIYGQGQGDISLPSVTPKEPPKAPEGYKYVPKDGGGWTAVEDNP